MCSQIFEKCISKESFDRQFVEDIDLDLICSREFYTVVTPSTLRYSETVIYIGGFSQGKETYRGELQDLVESGYKVIFVNPLMGIDVSEDESFGKLQKNNNLPDVICQKVAVLEEIMFAESLGQEAKVEMIGHSQGAIIAAMFASKHQQLVRSLILNSPAGFVTGKSRTWLALRFGYQLACNLVRKKDAYLKQSIGRAGKAFFTEAVRSARGECFLKTIFWRLKTEVPGISQVDLPVVLFNLKSSVSMAGGSQINTHLVTAYGDKLYSPSVYLNVLSARWIGCYVDSWSCFCEKEASHSAAGVERHGLMRQLLAN